MAEQNLYLDISKTLDYSNTSKERIQQLILSNDSRTLSAFGTFVKERESAFQETQKLASLEKLKKELDILLFGKNTSDFTQVKTQYTSNTTSNGVQSTTSYQFNSYSPPAAATLPGSSNTLNINSGVNLPTFQYSSSNLTASQTQPFVGTYQQSNIPSSSGNEEYMKNLMSKVNTTDEKIKKSNKNRSNQSQDDDEEVKRARKKAESEYNLDKRIQSVRENRKAQIDQPILDSAEKIRKEQQRLKIFKEKYSRDQPLAPELYKLFYDAVDELDFAGFLSLRNKLNLDEVNIKEVVRKQREDLTSGQKAVGVNICQYLEFMKAFNLQDEDIYYLLQIFFYLDFNNNGVLDSDEILLGFVMLGHSSEKEKLEAAFYVVDEDGSQTLSLQEMIKYMRCVIRMGDGRKFSFEDAFEHEFLIEKIATAAAHTIFKEMDLDENGVVSYEEFIVWHNLHGRQVEGLKEEEDKVKELLKVASGIRKDMLRKWNAFTLCNEEYNAITSKRISKVLNSKINETSIKAFRKVLSLDRISFIEAALFLKDYKVSEKLGFGAFLAFLKELYEHCKLKVDTTPIMDTINEFYNAIDLDSNGFVEWNEILGAFSLLCIGTENEKIRGIFQVFDANEDGILQFNEIYTLFLSSFNLIFLRNPESELVRQDPKKLAFSMAISSFSDNQLDPYVNGLDLDTFTNWYKNFDII